MRNTNGYIKLWRKTIESEIWEKPSDWFKIWCYILMYVNYEPNGLPIGSAKMNYDKICSECKVTRGTLDSCIRWLKSHDKLTTQKTTHAFIVSVSKYSQYQGEEKQEKTTQKTTASKVLHDNVLYKKEELRNISKDIETEFPEKKEIVKVDKRIPEIDTIINTISEHHGSIDGTQLENRRYGNLLKGKLDKITGFNGDYHGFIKVILENTDEYNVTKTTSCKSLYYNLAALVAKTKSKYQEANRSKGVRTISV